jgi:rfaE bifunctional protein nucleotidyltransferase chain/domain
MKRSLVVVGDVLLDVDVLTRAERLMPDAPAPVLEEVNRRVRPGGAALAAWLAARDPRVDVVLVAPVADDDAGRQISQLLAGSVRLIPLPCSGTTPVKTRLRSGGHTFARLDSGSGTAITEVTRAARGAVEAADSILVSDYGAGSTSDPEIRELLTCRAAARAMVWDPHPRGACPVPGVALVTPNAAEAATASGISGTAVGATRRAAETLIRRWHARSVAVTIGARGALLCFGTGASEAFPVLQASSGDTCGAGDCFAATAAIELATGALPSEAVARAVAAATHFVMTGGVASLDAATPAAALELPDADQVIAGARARDGLVVATGGCFDLLHAGHIQTLAAARTLGDCLIVCLNSDESVRRLKGDPRPLQSQQDRARVLAALRVVDAVVVFDEDTPMALLDRLRPDIWVKGGDYTSDQLPETDLVRQWGGEVVTVGYLGGRSTSRLLARAQE